MLPLGYLLLVHLSIQLSGTMSICTVLKFHSIIALNSFHPPGLRTVNEGWTKDGHYFDVSCRFGSF